MANTKRKPTKGKPISSHPLFPAVVALWFGALFGLGSLAIRPTLIESVVLKTGIDLIVPAAAPPLGVTARILIALVLAALGVAIGATLALRMNRPRTVVRERRRNAANPGTAAGAEAAMWNGRDVFSDGPARRPISAHDELGDSLDHGSLLASRRRPLAVEHEERPFEPHETAPLPGGEPQIFDIAATLLDPVSALTDPAKDLAPLDLGAFPAPTPPVAAAIVMQPLEAADAWSVAATPAEPVNSAMIERAAQPVTEPPRIFGMAAADGHVPVDFVRAAGFRTSVFESEPAQPLFAERNAPPAAAPDADLTEAAPPEMAPAPAWVPEPAAVPEPLPAPSGLGMTDLAKRLQESMARRRAARSEVMADAAPAETPAESPALEASAPAASPLPVEPAFVPPPPLPSFAPADAVPPAPIPMPAALRPVSFDLADDDDGADLAALMPRHLVMPAAATADLDPLLPAVAETTQIDEDPDAGAETAEAAADSFGSLLSIETPRQEFVRVEEPEDRVAAIEPVVIFPGQMVSAPLAPLRPFDAPAAAMPGTPVAQAASIPALDPAEAELALRSALANLQRISGVA